MNKLLEYFVTVAMFMSFHELYTCVMVMVNLATVYVGSPVTDLLMNFKSLFHLTYELKL